MAVIQDLPAEALYRIVELGAEAPKCFKGRDLCATALVARAWAQPSQKLLARELWSPDIPDAPYYDTSPPPTRLFRTVEVDSSEAIDRVRCLVERHGIQFHELQVYDEVPASDLASILTSGVRRLSLCGLVTGHSTFPDGTQLQLDSLYLSPSSTSFIEQLVDKSPHLTRLELWGESAVPPTCLTPLLAVAPRLRRITIFSPSRAPHAGRLDFCALLQACTSLVSLNLDSLGPGHLPALLSSVPTHLQLLVCTFSPYSSTDESVSNDLLDALKQPALANLKRWRWKFRLHSRAWISYLEDTVESWEAACRARGIEPRGDERYYTD